MANGELAKSWSSLSRTHGTSGLASALKKAKNKNEKDLFNSISEIVYSAFNEYRGTNADNKYVFIVDLIIERIEALVTSKLESFVKDGTFDDAFEEIKTGIESISNENKTSDINILNNNRDEIVSTILEYIKTKYNEQQSDTLNTLKMVIDGKKSTITNQLENNKLEDEDIEEEEDEKSDNIDENIESTNSVDNDEIKESDKSEKVDKDKIAQDIIEDETAKSDDSNDIKEEKENDEDDEKEEKEEKEEKKDDSFDIREKFEKAFDKLNSKLTLIIMFGVTDLKNLNKRLREIAPILIKVTKQFERAFKVFKDRKLIGRLNNTLKCLEREIVTLFNKFKKLIDDIDIKKTLSQFVDDTIKSWGSLLDKVFKIITKLVLNVITLKIILIMGLIVLLVRYVLAPIAELLNPIIEKIATAIKGVSDTLRATMERVGGTLSSTLMKYFSSNLRRYLLLMNNVVFPVLNEIKDIITVVVTVLFESLTYVFPLLSTMMNAIAPFAQTFGEWLVSGAVVLIGLITKLFSSIDNSVIEMLGSIISSFICVILDVAIAFVGIIKPFAKTLGSLLAGIFIILMKILITVCKMIKPFAKLLGTIIATVFIIFEPIITLVCSIISDVLSILEKIMPFFKLLFEAIRPFAYPLGVMIAWLLRFLLPILCIIFKCIRPVARFIGELFSWVILQFLRKLNDFLVWIMEKLDVNFSVGDDEDTKIMDEKIGNLVWRTNDLEQKINNIVINTKFKDIVIREKFISIRFMNIKKIINFTRQILIGDIEEDYNPYGFFADTKEHVENPSSTILKIVDILKKIKELSIWLEDDYINYMTFLDKFEKKSDEIRLFIQNMVAKNAEKNAEFIKNISMSKIDIKKLNVKLQEEIKEFLIELQNKVIEISDNTEKEFNTKEKLPISISEIKETYDKPVPVIF